MIYIHYNNINGDILGAYHHSNDNIPTPNIPLTDEQWNSCSTGHYKVDLATLGLVEVKVEQGVKEVSTEQVDELRRLAYIKEADPLFFKWQRKECTKKEWTDKIKEIKKRYPKSTD